MLSWYMVIRLLNSDKMLKIFEDASPVTISPNSSRFATNIMWLKHTALHMYNVPLLLHLCAANIQDSSFLFSKKLVC